MSALRSAYQKGEMAKVTRKDEVTGKEVSRPTAAQQPKDGANEASHLVLLLLPINRYNGHPASERMEGTPEIGIKVLLSESKNSRCGER